MSDAGGGAGTGLQGSVSNGERPLASGSGKPAKRDTKKKKKLTVMKDEKLDIVNEVMRLIKERGILR